MAWAHLARTCVGRTADRVWGDLSGTQHRSADAYQLLGRARDPINGMFWALDTVLSADMFVAQPEVLAHIDSDDWLLLDVPHDAAAAQP